MKPEVIYTAAQKYYNYTLMKNLARDAWLKANQNKANYSFRTKKFGNDYRTCDKKKSYCGSICFDSETLNNFAEYLRSYCDCDPEHRCNVKVFNKVNKNDTWHISLYCKKTADARDKFENQTLNGFKDSLKNLPWYVWVVKKPDLTCSRDNETSCVESGCCDISCWGEHIIL